jgi:D-alanyl-D-alanine carboxypeptidase-like protein
MMNDYSHRMGLSETRFASSHGLPEPDQHTTAADMVKLASLLLKRFPDALDYTSVKEYTFHQITQRNWNTLLFYDARVDGPKTGHVDEAGFHLVATAHQDKRAVNLGADGSARCREAPHGNREAAGMGFPLLRECYPGLAAPGSGFAAFFKILSGKIALFFHRIVYLIKSAIRAAIRKFNLSAPGWWKAEKKKAPIPSGLGIGGNYQTTLRLM